MKKIGVAALCCCLVFTMILCMVIGCAPAYAEENEKVRVGFYREEGYHDVDAFGNHTGYDYEYLMEIAKYTGWEYEFVEGTWQECISMLENGEIDILGGVEKNESRMDTINFGRMPSAYSSQCLLIERNSDRYIYEDFASFNGMIIGSLKGSSMINALTDYSRNNGFSYRLLLYDTEEELKEALERKEIDCVYLSDVRDLEDYRIIGRFGFTPLYYATNIRRANLCKELDDALVKIHADNHYYDGELFNEYFTTSAQATFTVEEQNYIKNHPVVTVALVDGFPLICDYNESAGDYEGIIMDILKELSERTGLQFHYTKLPEGKLPGYYLEDHPNTVMAPLLINSLVDYTSIIKKLDTIVQGKMVTIKRIDDAIHSDGDFILSIPASMFRAEEQLHELFPRAKIIQSPSHQESLNQVKDGRADIALVNEIVGTYLLQSPYYRNLYISHTENISEDISLALGYNSDPVLISILNKGISTFSVRDIRQIVVDNTVSHSYKKSLDEWIYENKILLLLLVILLIGTIIIFRRRQLEKETKKQLQITEERLNTELIHQKELFYHANFDMLTGLYNESYFIEKANERMKNHPDTIYTFFYMNIEHFKMTNEIYGWKRGDTALKKIGENLKNFIGSNGVYGRIYSDHFAVCYPCDKETLLKEPVNSLFYEECDGQQIRIQMNIGVYVNTDMLRDAAQLLVYARIAMQNGSFSENSYVHFYKNDYMEALLKNQKIVNAMEQALQEGEFHVFLQPQFDHIKQTLIGAEALVRWFHPEQGMISPGDFIPIFEENRFIGKLDKYICEEVCRLLAKWKKQGKLVPVSVNLSRIDLMNPELLPDLKGFLNTYDIPAEYLHLEITESSYAENQGELIHSIEKLRQSGFIIEMDDFGSAYSSLNMLKDAPVDVLKLDMKFFSEGTHMDKGRRIIEAVVKLAHSLGLPVIAEGVETERESNFLQLAGCHMVQGYLYGKPMTVEAFEELLADNPIGKKQLLSFDDEEFT